ncbi:hypothetical protein A2379_04735 [Candidatus Amesbacteria bacterium RIFOXYB1_FULL_47_13]|nr:MAG: hypothetical protein A2379_04735 [Candidatus Amesbacteria bacterium RIFOXYB1_FULL_47_13]HBC72785.1 hypothetical protein [Candidatus Amesbacteria bacterium]
MRNLYRFLFLIWVGVLFLRSAQYVFRTYREFTSPPPVYHSEVIPCSSNPDQLDGEDRQLYYYRSLGVVCPK